MKAIVNKKTEYIIGYTTEDRQETKEYIFVEVETPIYGIAKHIDGKIIPEEQIITKELLHEKRKEKVNQLLSLTDYIIIEISEAGIRGIDTTDLKTKYQNRLTERAEIRNWNEQMKFAIDSAKEEDYQSLSEQLNGGPYARTQKETEGTIKTI